MWMIRRLGICAAVIGVAPLAVLALAFMISAATGCKISEAGMPPCLHFGIDFAGLTKSLLAIGISTAMLAVPPALALVVLWILLELIHMLRGSPSS